MIRIKKDDLGVHAISICASELHYFKSKLRGFLVSEIKGSIDFISYTHNVRISWHKIELHTVANLMRVLRYGFKFWLRFSSFEILLFYVSNRSAICS